MITNGKEILCYLGLIDAPEDYNEYVQQQKINKAKLLEEELLEGLDENIIKIYKCIKENGVINFEIMCNQLNMSIQDINTYLTILELKGLISSKFGGNYCISEQFYM